MSWECETFRRIPRNFSKKIRARQPAGIGVFARVFEGGFGKSRVSWWCFCGEFVVDCVVNVVRWMVCFQR
jgi:hypothetical protein